MNSKYHSKHMRNCKKSKLIYSSDWEIFNQLSALKQVRDIFRASSDTYKQVLTKLLVTLI